jgi:alanine transaminase
MPVQKRCSAKKRWMSEFFAEDDPYTHFKESMTVQNMNPAVVRAQYAVRGSILDRAHALERQLKDNPGSLPFDEVVKCNIGNPQGLGQPPLTFHRQVVSLVLAPDLLRAARVEGQQLTWRGFEFQADTILRAQRYADSVKSIGAYSHSQGIPLVRQEVAAFVAARDGELLDNVNPDHIFLTNGASEGVRLFLTAMLRQRPTFNDGLLVPIPQYPLYSAQCTILGGSLVPYYLEENRGWDVTVAELSAQLANARKEGVNVRGLVVINPGNPTGNTLSLEIMEEVVKLCAEEGLVLLADEVYQDNIWSASKPFHSFRKVARGMGFEDRPGSGLSLVSFHSVSKGFVGECGIRGGYFELFGFDDGVVAQLRKWHP